MNLYELERKRNKNIERKQSTQQKLWNANIGLSEAAQLEQQTKEELYDARVKHENTIMGRNFTQSRSAIRKRMISEKMRFESNYKEELFKEAVYNLYMESLLLDDDFKELYSENLRELCFSTVSDLMKERKITLKSLGENSSVFIQDLVSLCEETAKKEADEKYDITKIGAEVNNKTKVLNEKPEKEDVMEKGKALMSELLQGPDAVDDVVKDKVINMVRCQQDFEEKEEMVKGEIADETVDGSVLDARSEDELEAKRLSDLADIDDDVNDTFDFPEINEAMMLQTNRIRRPNKLQEEDIFKSLQINIASKALKESALSESHSADINMDLVYAEALSYYTLLETLHTARIVEFTAREARSLAKELVFRSK